MNLPVQFHFAHGSYARGAKPGELEEDPGMTVSVCQLRPESQGSIHIQNNDPSAAPAIRPNFFSEAVDRNALIGGMRVAREGRRSTSARSVRIPRAIPRGKYAE
ncbi:MAG: hypothetical protein CM1200mP24_05180 [Gammaproteobacteria bacterium]|nr:MAG: hypothetical protein CM1200mP24_05180 [Gammaproteobacteria bacterium]